MVICITMVVPLVTDVSSTPIWGRAYDKFNLAYVRTFAGIFSYWVFFFSFSPKVSPYCVLHPH